MSKFELRNFHLLAGRYIDYTFMWIVYKISVFTSKRIKYNYIREEYVLVWFGKMASAYWETYAKRLYTACDREKFLNVTQGGKCI